MFGINLDDIEGVEINPNCKKGDRIFIITSRNMGQQFESQEFTVVQGSQTQGNSITIIDPVSSAQYNMYRTGNPADLYFISTRENKIAMINFIIEQLKLKQQFYERYENREEFVADQIELLLSKGDRGEKAEVLKLLKRENYL